MSNNPFSITKANDLTDEQINALWVDIKGDPGSSTLFDAGKFQSPMPTFILGGKGSGKTHLMRYASYPLQQIRFLQDGLSITDGLKRDGYLGIYVRCSGLDTGRFRGKGQSEEAWAEVFSYYLELWLGQTLLNIFAQIFDSDGLQGSESSLCSGITDLFDDDATPRSTLVAHCEDMNRRRKRLDYEVNNAAFGGGLSPGVALTRGKLIFGLPKLLATVKPELSGIQFCYQLDELENLTEPQQIHVNTLVRERESPATFKIGARQFGIRSHKTLSAEEENLRDSEFDELRLDRRFRENEGQYRDLADRLVERRLQEFRANMPTKATGSRMKDWFEEADLDWQSKLFSDLFASVSNAQRHHFQSLRKVMRIGFTLNAAPGVESDATIELIVAGLSVPEHPLLEKLNLLILYGEWSRQNDLPTATRKIREQCEAFRRGEQGPYAEKLKRYKSDLVAQLLRENGRKQIYAGLSSFVRMSEGQPRALITLLKHTYDWALFQGEEPFVEGKISYDAQSRGAMSSAEWFYNSMMQAGTDGRDILIAVDRLSQLFRINRFTDNIRECALIGFSASVINVSDRAAYVLKKANDRSFLVDIEGGQQERNSEQVTKKFQLNRMLSPRWALGTARRGIVPFDRAHIEAIFDPDQEEAFIEIRRKWETRASAPLFGKHRDRVAALEETVIGEGEGQTDLFDQ